MQDATFLSLSAFHRSTGSIGAKLVVYDISRETGSWESHICQQHGDKTVIYIYQNMSLWVDKYRPTSLGKLDYHKDQAVQLKNLVR